MAAKLYWRIKKNGKWTWKPAKTSGSGKYVAQVLEYTEEEE